MNDTSTGYSFYRGRCGHKWVASTYGSYACPACADYEGDHHLIEMTDIDVLQVELASDAVVAAQNRRQARMGA